MDLATDCKIHYGRFIADMKCSCQYSEFHNKASKVYVRERSRNEKGLFQNHGDELWGILADRSCQGASGLPPVINHVWLFIRGDLTTSQLQFNGKPPPDRSIVKNILDDWKVCGLIFRKKLYWIEAVSDKNRRYFFTVRSCHESSHLLRETGNAYFSGVRGCIWSIFGIKERKALSYLAKAYNAPLSEL